MYIRNRDRLYYRNQRQAESTSPTGGTHHSGQHQCQCLKSPEHHSRLHSCLHSRLQSCSHEKDKQDDRKKLHDRAKGTGHSQVGPSHLQGATSPLVKRKPLPSHVKLMQEAEAARWLAIQQCTGQQLPMHTYLQSAPTRVLLFSTTL